MKSLLVLLLYTLLIIPGSAQEVRDDILTPRRMFAPKVKLKECDMPEAVDNSTCKYFPPVISQTGGSCAQASGIGYMFTYEINRLLNRDASASKDNRFSYLFSWNMVNGGEDQGGFVDEGLDIARRYGMMTEADYGFSSTYGFRWPSGYDKYLNAMRYRVDEIYTFADSVPLMKRWLYDAGNGSTQGGVLTFSGMSSGWRMNDGYNGPSLTDYHSIVTGLPSNGSHAMTIVGYDDTVTFTDASGTIHTGAFIVCNSWGEYSHDRGRFYYPYDFFRDPDVSNLVLSNQVTAISVRIHEPKVVYKVKLRYTSRDDLHFALSANSSYSGSDLSGNLKWHSVMAFYNAGGDHPMQGYYADATIELAMDYTENMTTPDDLLTDYHLDIIRSMRGSKKGEGQLLALSVIDYRHRIPQESVYQGSLPIDIANGHNQFTIRNQADPIEDIAADSDVLTTAIYQINGILITAVTGADIPTLPHGTYIIVGTLRNGTTVSRKIAVK